MNTRPLRAKGADLSSREAVEEAMDSAKRDRDSTWEEAAKRAESRIPKWGRRHSGVSRDREAERHPT